MKFFLVTPDDFDYDQWDGFVIRAENHAQARKMAEKFAKNASAGTNTQKWSAVEIKVEGEPKVILDSFRAG